MENTTRLQELIELLEENCGTYEDNCKTCPYYAECEEYCKLSNIYHIVND